MVTILVIEQDIRMRRRIMDVLGYEGFRAHGAEDEHSAVEQVKIFRPDVIVYDIFGTECDSANILKEFRRDPGAAQIPFIFLTAFSPLESPPTWITNPFICYVSKPFQIDELLAAIYLCLNRPLPSPVAHDNASGFSSG